MLIIFYRMLSKSLENSLSYGIFYKFWKKARVYHTLCISRVGGGRPRHPPPDSPLSTSRVLYTHYLYCSLLFTCLHRPCCTSIHSGVVVVERLERSLQFLFSRELDVVTITFSLKLLFLERTCI